MEKVLTRKSVLSELLIFDLTTLRKWKWDTKAILLTANKACMLHKAGHLYSVVGKRSNKTYYHRRYYVADHDREKR